MNMFSSKKNKTFTKGNKKFTALFVLFSLLWSAMFFASLPSQIASATSTSTCIVYANTGTSIASGQTVTWTASIVGNLPATITWAGDEGLSGSDYSVTKTYTTSGIKNAAVKAVITSEGSTAIDCNGVTISTSISPLPLPTVSLLVNGSQGPVTFPSGTTLNLSWTATDSASCLASGGWTGNKNASAGSEVVGPFNSSQSFTISCQNTTGTVSDTVTAIVESNGVACIAPQITSPLSLVATSGSQFSYTITSATTSTSTVSFSINPTDLPAGLSFNGNNIISGIPATTTATTTVNIPIVASNDCRDSTFTLSLTIYPAITTPAEPTTSSCSLTESTPSVISSGQSVFWSTTYSANVPVSIAWSGDENLTGTTTEITKIYQAEGVKSATVFISGTGIGASVNCLSLTASTTPIVIPTNPSVDLKVNNSNGPLTVSKSDILNISWTSTDVNVCTASNGWTGSRGTSGATTTGPLATSTIFTLTCQNTTTSAETSDSVTVNVNGAMPMPTIDLKANGSDGPITVNTESSVVLAWTTTNSASCMASGSWIGSKSPVGGTEVVGPLNEVGSYTYTLECHEGNNSATDSVTVNVTLPPVIPPVTPPVTPSGGGGGGRGGSTSLYIFDEKITEIAPGIALVQWQTNKPATRRVVYGDNSSTVLVGENFGYTGTTAEIREPLLKVHSMVVFNLASGVNHYFRPVSSDGYRVATGVELSLVSSVETSCNYLYDYLKLGWENNPIEVRKLQIFLRDLEGINVQVTGVFDEQTFNAVSVFQSRYAGDILNPWGVNNSTGFVYILTKKKVNEIYCQFAFPLTSAQETEIANYRNFIENLNREGLITGGSTTVPNIIMPTTTPKGQNLETEQEVGFNVATSTLAGVTDGSGISSIYKSGLSNVASVIVGAFNSIPDTVKSVFEVLIILAILYILVYLLIKDRADKGQNAIISIRIMSYITGLVLVSILAMVFKLYYIAISLCAIAIFLLPFLVYFGMIKDDKIKVSEIDLGQR